MFVGMQRFSWRSGMRSVDALLRFGGAPRVVVFVDGQAGSLPYGGTTIDQLDNNYYHFRLVEALGRLGRAARDRCELTASGGCAGGRWVFKISRGFSPTSGPLYPR